MAQEPDLIISASKIDPCTLCVLFARSNLIVDFYPLLCQPREYNFCCRIARNMQMIYTGTVWNSLPRELDKTIDCLKTSLRRLKIEMEIRLDPKKSVSVLYSLNSKQRSVHPVSHTSKGIMVVRYFRWHIIGTNRIPSLPDRSCPVVELIHPSWTLWVIKDFLCMFFVSVVNQHI